MCVARTLRSSGKDQQVVCARTSKAEDGFRIRPFAAEDAVATSEILLEAPEAATWSAEAILAIYSSGGVSGFISETRGQQTGFILGRAVLDEGEILNLAVSKASRRLGEGSALAEAILDNFRAHRVSRIFLEVRESNLVAIAFYKKLGFRQVGKRGRYYREPVEAALILEHRTKNPQAGTE